MDNTRLTWTTTTFSFMEFGLGKRCDENNFFLRTPTVSADDFVNMKVPAAVNPSGWT